MIDETGKTENRLTILEEKLEYQDYTLEKLNEVIITQQRQLDRLENDLLKVCKTMEAERAELKGKQQRAGRLDYG